MWSNFDGHPYDAPTLAAHVAALDFSHWRRKDGSVGKPLFVTLHNTSEPDLKTWLSWAPEKRQSYIHNVQNYYEHKLGWAAGPHYFVPPDDGIVAFGFSNPVTAGTHCSCFNSDSIGIEMVGEFNVEPFDSGPGAAVRDHAVYLMALLHNKLGLDPEHQVYGKSGLHFHIECVRDNHDCPGKFVHKADVVARVKAKMVELAGPLPVSTSSGPSISPLPTASPVDVATTSPSSAGRFATIMTMFAGRGDRETSAYPPFRVIDARKVGFSLPFHFPEPRPGIRVYANGKTCEGPLVDVGPGATHDKYWETGTKPIAHNGAGLDATNAVWDVLGIHDDRRGKTQVEWEFITQRSGDS